MQIGSKVKKLRELRNFTQSYLADYLDITQSTYSRYEKDELHFTADMLQKLATLLGLSVSAIQQFDEHKIFQYIESVANCAHHQSIKEQKLSADLLQSLQNENELLRSSLQDLRSVINTFKKA